MSSTDPPSSGDSSSSSSSSSTKVNKARCNDYLKEQQVKPNPTLMVWKALAKLNGVKYFDNGDCMMAHRGDSTVVSCAPIMPHCEGWVTVILFWLRVNGVADRVLPSGEKEDWRNNFKNLAPLVPWVAKRLTYEIGGFAFFGTKKCLWRLCVVAMVSLYKAAIVQRHRPTKEYTFDMKKNLLEFWTIPIDMLSKHGIGEAYLDEYKEDYARNELSVWYCSDLSGRCKVAPIFENHFMVIKSFIPGDDDVDEGDLRSIKRTMNKGGVTVVEDTIWTPPRKGNPKTIPQQTSRMTLTMSKEGEEDLSQFVYEERMPVGPTMFVPFDPMVSVPFFWTTLRRLVEEEGYIIDGVEMNELMELSDLFIELTLCVSPTDLWKVKIPPWLGEKLPPIPEADTLKTGSRKLLLKEELAQREAEWHAFVAQTMFQLAGPVKWNVASEPSIPCTLVPPFNQPCAYSEPSFSKERQTLSSASSGHLLVGRQSTPQLDQLLLNELGLRVMALDSALLLELETWIASEGEFEGLNRFRRTYMGKHEKEFARLCTEVQGVCENYTLPCRQSCFADLRRYTNEDEYISSRFISSNIVWLKPLVQTKKWQRHQAFLQAWRESVSQNAEASRLLIFADEVTATIPNSASVCLL